FIGEIVMMQHEMTRQDELDDIVSTTSAAFLSLTMGCARCHNHKYDPLAQKDYYRLVTVFAPSVRANIPLAPASVVEKYEKQVLEIDRKIDALTQQIRLQHKPKRDRLLETKYKEHPQPIQAEIQTEPSKQTEP